MLGSWWEMFTVFEDLVYIFINELYIEIKSISLFEQYVKGVGKFLLETFSVYFGS